MSRQVVGEVERVILARRLRGDLDQHHLLRGLGRRGERLRDRLGAHVRQAAHSSLCSASTGLTRQTIEARSGNMPTTSVRRRISLLGPSSE